MSSPDPTTPGPTGDVTVGGATTLRGAAVEIDARRAGQVVAALAVAGLVAVAVVLAVAGYQKNAQVSTLRDRGVPVQATVTACVSLVGGSGSNLAGFACTAQYTVAGRTYQANVPGSAAHEVGDQIYGVTVPSDPALFSTPRAVAASHPSARVFLLPAVLLVAAVVITAALVLRRSRRRSPLPAGAGAEVPGTRATLSHGRS